MKRVLNSGTIKLPYFTGTEQDQLALVSEEYPSLSFQERVERLASESSSFLKEPIFRFELKAPALIFLAFQNSGLGVLETQEVANHLEGYLPPQFYKQDPSEFIPMASKDCNELNTKLNNFYNWSFNFYNKLRENGLCKEQAQLVLPQGLFITFLWTVSAKDLIKFIETQYSISPEMFGYCSSLSMYLDEQLPLVSRWLKRNKWKGLL